MEFAIEIQDLKKQFGDFIAVDGISFSIPKGKIFGFLGPNGSGKSTTIRMLCGVLRPTSGKGTVLGLDILQDAEKIKQNIGYMSQKFGLYEDLTILENLQFFASIYGIPKKELGCRIDEILDLCALRGRENAIVGILSGGWKQRVALGCSLLHKPALLILDEPTAGVDPVSRRVFWEVIHTLSREGITILVTTHYMDEAESCDILGFIYRGKIIALGSVGEIMEENNNKNIEDIFISYVEKISDIKVRGSFRDMKDHIE
ncbi:MAG: transporter ATP-binding protein [Anaerosolibacter sp.]|jgi:ABC-2 type transport system ATP-binding protein|uniref:ABC transporter ATP-binding protein n=1 Tax=Anaerosolibacter sp. TaxID=1872527 RepID=UPI0026245645|nr:ABC transporter ATP-binding protein [Anaerosolibacter sp.]MDF2545299.1 transporter ATP-binding protein [Anaerosolibacter sp.]